MMHSPTIYLFRDRDGSHLERHGPPVHLENGAQREITEVRLRGRHRPLRDELAVRELATRALLGNVLDGAEDQGAVPERDDVAVADECVDGVNGRLALDVERSLGRRRTCLVRVHVADEARCARRGRGRGRGGGGRPGAARGRGRGEGRVPAQASTAVDKRRDWREIM